MPTPAESLSSPSSCLSLAECVANLTVLFQLHRELVRMEAGWLAGVPYWDAKLALADHILTDAQHTEALLKRLHELKAAASERKHLAGTEHLMREFASAVSGDEWLHGVYQALKPWLATQLQAYLDHSDPLMDAPSRRVVQPLIRDLEAQVAWFDGFTPSFSGWQQADLHPWMDYARALTGSTRIADGQLVGIDHVALVRPSGRPDFTPVSCPRRDPAFNATALPPVLTDGDREFASQQLDVFYHHTQEMQFAESIGATLYEAVEMPWAFQHDLARHLADEVRHSQMGQVRLEQLGYRLADMPMNTHNYAFRANLDPVERFCLMTLVLEAMSFQSKRANVALFEARGDEVSARYESYDIRDEMLHTNLGHVWVPVMLRVYHDSRSVPELVDHCRRMVE